MRLLLVTYYFPPSGGAGVQRPLKWVKYLPQAGVQPIVVTVREGAYPQRDPSLLAEIPPGVSVHRTAAVDPFGLYARLTGRSREAAVAARTDDVGQGGGVAERLARWLRANVFVPDARVGWVPFALARALHLHRTEGFDVVVTTGPPHSVHLVGWALGRFANVPWIADFRDPWTDIHYLGALPRARPVARLDAALERAVLHAADAVVTVSPSWARLLAERAGRPVEVIPNGYDPADFEAVRGGGFAVRERRGAGPPVVVHVGSLYKARNPHALWAALAAEPDLARVRVVGRVGEAVRAAADAAGARVEWVPYVPHAEAVAALCEADVLLLATEPQAHEAGHVTGKLYEYVATGRPVLGLGDPHGDAAVVLAETGAGVMLARDDVEGVRAFLRGGYRGYGGRPRPEHARPAQAAALAALARRVVARSLPR